MLPIVFSFGSVTLYSLGLLLALGFFLGTFIIWRRLRELGLEEEKILDFIILSAIFGFLFSWGLGQFQKDGFSGLTLAVNLLAVGLVLLWFSRKERWNFWQIADEAVFGILPWLILFQIGIFLDGSDNGKPTGLSLGVYFPGSLVRTLPVSVFAALAFFLIWLFLLQIERQWRAWAWYKSKKEGFLALIFLMLALLAHFGLAFYRRSDLYWYWLEMSLYGLGFVAAAGYFYSRSGRKLKEELGIPIMGRKDESQEEKKQTKISQKN